MQGAEFALKVVRNTLDVLREEDVHLMCNSPLIIKLHETYTSPNHFHFLMEYAGGGELAAAYDQENLWGNESCAKYYVAGTTLALHHLHSKKIIHRELKPDNLLRSREAHVKLTDLGVAKVVESKTYTMVGAISYRAPEVIAAAGHGHPCDWWALGILLHELMSGRGPFEVA